MGLPDQADFNIGLDGIAEPPWDAGQHGNDELVANWAWDDSGDRVIMVVAKAKAMPNYGRDRQRRLAGDRRADGTDSTARRISRRCEHS